ncbi:MAG TPA: YncE family protein [Terriglobales bacterium]|jgi:YVTN family beta-propeller protein
MSKGLRRSIAPGLIRRVAFLALAAGVCSTAGAQSLLTNVTVGFDPVAVAVNATTNKVYVVNQNSNTLTIIDGLTNQTVTVATGLLPTAIAINPVTNKIYVTNGNSNSVTVVDGQSNRTTSVSTGSYPLGIAINTVTNRIYVTNFNANSVTVIDGATNATTTIGVGQRPLPVAVNSVTNMVYVGNQNRNSVCIIDGNAGVVTTTVGVGSRPQAIGINSLTNQIYVANYQSASVSVIDGVTRVVTPVTVGSYPAALAVDAGHNRVYVANSGDNSSTIIDGATLATTNVTVGAYPVAVDVDPVTNIAYFATQQNYGSIIALKGTDFSTVSVAVGSNPSAVVLDQLTNRVYTANAQNNTASVIVGGTSLPLQFMPVTPCRLVDTRSAPGPFGGPAIAGSTWRSFALPQSGCSIPAAAAAYSLNVTAIPRGPLGYLTIWPTGEAQPSVSTLNSPDHRVKANAAIVYAGSGGAVSVYVSDTTDLILDMDGYFQPASEQTLQFYPLTPCRVFDTRTQEGHLGGPYLHGTQERDFPVLWSNCQIPDNAQAYSLNFTAVPWQGRPLGYLTVWAAGGSQPGVSTLNNPTATVVANAAIVPAGVGGAIAVYPSQNTDLIADINGYFAAPGAGGLSLYPTAPCRVLDTRSNGGAFSGQRNPAVNVAASPCGISSGAGSYVFNATVVPVGALGYLTLWPDGQAQPGVSTLNAQDGITASNMAVLPVQDGKIDAYAFGTTQLILDISGYFAP